MPRTAATRRSCSTSSATSSSRRTSSPSCSRSRGTVTSRRLPARCTRSSSAATRTCSATRSPTRPAGSVSAGRRSRPSRRDAPGSSTTFPRRCPGFSTPARCSAVPPPSGSTGRSSTVRSPRCAKSSARSTTSSVALGDLRPRPSPTHACSRSSATSSSRSSTSRASSTSTPSWPCARRARRFVARVELAERARGRRGRDLGGARPRRPGALVHRGEEPARDEA